jgi:hypothetical protein
MENFRKEDLINIINVYQNYINDFVNISDKDIDYMYLEIAKQDKELNRGGGYINEIAREKSKLIKTPLKYNLAWNEKVNQAKTMEDINKLNLIK